MPHPNDILGSPERLAAIAASELLDTGALPALDRVVRAAARLLHAPVAQLNVVTADQQIPVSHFGGEEWGCAVGLERSYCQHAVRSRQPLVVEDAREHPLVRESPATAESGIVGYLSVPLRPPRAEAPIGTLCLVDFQPRRWTRDDIATLTDLGAWALSEIQLRVQHLRESRRAEEALNAAEARLRLALDAAELGDWELDLRTGESPRRSLRHDRIFGYPGGVKDWSYQRFLEHVHPEDRDEVDRRFHEALESGEAWDLECRILRADQELRWIWARGRIQRDPQGKPLQALGLVQDITDRKRLLRETEAARSEAEAANRAKAEFLAVMSHELRTPLNAISGYAELLELGVHGPMTEAQREALKRIQLSQRHLLGLINEVLNYAKLETGRVHYQVEEVRVQDLLASVEDLIAPQVRVRGLTLTCDQCDPRLVVQADAEKVRQILVNLLSNAAKFTDPPGRIEILCEPRGSRVHLAVRDTGIGIPTDKLDRIFEPFVQVRSDLTRTAEGTGLGLAISRDLARGMGGDLTAESTPGVGSTFVLSLPAPGQHEDEANPERRSGEDRRRGDDRRAPERGGRVGT